MSTDWSIPLSAPLDVPALMETMRETFQELLNLTTSIQLYFDVIVGGEEVVSQSLPPILDEDSPMFHIFYESKDNWGTGVQLFTNIYPADDEEPEEFKAVVTMTGGGGDTRFRRVTLYGCAIAIARASNSLIEEFRESPQELMEAFRCRQPHVNWREAFEEVLVNLDQYWSQFHARLKNGERSSGEG